MLNYVKIQRLDAPCYYVNGVLYFALFVDYIGNFCKCKLINVCSTL